MWYSVIAAQMDKGQSSAARAIFCIDRWNPIVQARGFPEIRKEGKKEGFPGDSVVKSLLANSGDMV